jgi:membrane associated rhomboid family serine protease
MLPVFVVSHKQGAVRFVFAILAITVAGSLVWQVHSEQWADLFLDRWAAIPCEVSTGRTLSYQELKLEDCNPASLQGTNPTPAYAAKHPLVGIATSLTLAANYLHALAAIAVFAVFGWAAERELGRTTFALAVSALPPLAIVFFVLFQPDSVRPLTSVDFPALVVTGLVVGANTRGTAYVMGPGVIPVRRVTAGLLALAIVVATCEAATLVDIAIRALLVLVAALIARLSTRLNQNDQSVVLDFDSPLVPHKLSVRSKPNTPVVKVLLPKPGWYRDPWRSNSAWRWHDGRRWSYAHSLDGRRPPYAPSDAIGAVKTADTEQAVDAARTVDDAGWLTSLS